MLAARNPSRCLDGATDNAIHRGGVGDHACPSLRALGKTAQIIFGFHAVGARMRSRAESVREIFVDAKRDDKRMQALIENAKAKDLRVMLVDGKRLDGMTGNARHQGVVANVEAAVLPQFVDDVLDLLTVPPLLLLLDGVTDPHNLGACLRVADAAGAHAVIAPKDRSVGADGCGHESGLRCSGIDPVHHCDQSRPHPARIERP